MNNKSFKELIFYVGNTVKIAPPDKPFVLSSGKTSDFYINCKEILLKKRPMELISNCINIINRNLSYYVVAGVTSGADPIVCGCVAFHYKDGLLIRKKQKDYGTKVLIEGDYRVGDKVLIVDDVLTTGGAIRYAYDVLIEHDLRPVGVTVVVDRQENNARETLEEDLKIPVRSICTREDLIKHKEEFNA